MRETLYFKYLRYGGILWVFNGHNQPMCVLPYGVEAEIDCNNKTFSIVDTGVS